MRRFSLSLVLFLMLNTLIGSLKADEGMWLLSLLQQQKYEDMKAKGLKLTPEQLYSINGSSLKDAIFGLNSNDPRRNFCTSEAISSDGLLLTNHHCAYDMIQNHSSVQNDYLTEGFWAMSYAEELPNPGISASFLVRMEDVTEKINNALKGLSDQEKAAKMQQIQQEIVAEATKDTHYDGFIKDFFFGNEFYLFVMETFRDVRLVGAPPSSIGKFGGDTDNWMWPRHTGDFAFLRIYAGKDGKPADYSKDNVPYKPKHFLPISYKGVEENDFAMVLGFPGTTERYKTSHGLEIDYAIKNPARIKLREKRLALMKEDMDASDKVRIAYASKYAQVSNYYKYFKGQNRGLKRLRTIEHKQTGESAFQQWATDTGKEAFKTALPMVASAYEGGKDVQLPSTYFEEAVFGTEIISFAFQFTALKAVLGQEKEMDKSDFKEAINEFKEAQKEHFKDYSASTDKKIFAALLQMFYEDVERNLHPAPFEEVRKNHNGDFSAYADVIFSNSMFADAKAMDKFLAKPKLKDLESDPAFKLAEDMINYYRSKLGMKSYMSSAAVEQGMKNYVTGLREMNPDKHFYPDANSTIRLTYGTVRSYKPQDAVFFNFYTTIEGIMEKADPTDKEFIVPEKLIKLYKEGKYGDYADKDGKLRVGFITDNDITGGNSGSPVIDGEGNLIGLAFDGNWESMTGDLVYDPEFKRCINVDIRYVMFIVEKYAGANWLFENMKIVK